MAIELGFTSVMMDGSLLADGKTPSDYEYNVEVTREVVEAAHAKGVSVEGELGTLGGIEDGHGSGEVHLTDPDQAVDFVEKTGVDALAVAIGTSHGAYKFTSKPTGEVLAMHLIEEIHQKLPDTHMVMHGSSSVPQELVDRINAAGGKLEATFGVPVEEIQQGIRHGVRKVNVDTDGRLAITAALREALNADPSEFDPRAFFKPAREAQKQVVVRAADAVRRSRPRRRLQGALARRDGKALPGEPRWRLSQQHRPAQHQHDPDADGRRRSGGEVGPSRVRRSALAPAAYLLYTRIMKHNPADPKWADRDRFVLSAGHASMLLYACLHLSGYDLSLDDIKQFRQLGSRHAGPSRELRDAGRRDDDRSARPGLRQRGRDGDGREVPAREFGEEVCDHHIFAICSDGDLMEGVASEAASLAGHLQARPLRLPLRRQQGHDRRAAPTRRSRRRTSPSASMRTAGTRSRSRTATTSRRSRPRFARASPRKSARR